MENYWVVYVVAAVVVAAVVGYFWRIWSFSVGLTMGFYASLIVVLILAAWQFSQLPLADDAVPAPVITGDRAGGVQ